MRNLKILYKHRIKIKEVKATVQNKLGSISFAFASFGGADINYYLLQNKKRFAMMRLGITDIQKDNERPVLRFNKEKRLKKEFEAYSLGGPKGLTPNVIYFSSDVLVCEYLEGKRVFDILKQDKSQVWKILIDATTLYQKLHVLNVVHLDATLKNFVMVNSTMKVIDFEYYPAQRLTIETQKAYDYVRIIEHTLRSVPMKYQNNFSLFIEHLDNIVPTSIRSADFSELRGLMDNIKTFPMYTQLKEQIFINI